MAVDAKGNSHKAAGRADGGQFDGKAGQGFDDDLEVPTTAATVAPDEGWWASLENDPEAMAGPEPDVEPETPADPGGEKPDEGWWRSLEGAPATASTKPDGKSETSLDPDDDGSDKGWWNSQDDDGRWRDKDERTPELEAMRKTVMDARDRKGAEAILTGLPELARCAVIRSLPFAYKTAVADLTPDPDGQSDLATMVAGLPYSEEDAERGALLGRTNRGDVRAAVALAVYGAEMDLRWLSGKSVAKHPSVAAALKHRGVEPSETRVLIESLGRVADAIETGAVEAERLTSRTKEDKAAEPEKPSTKGMDEAKTPTGPIKAERPASKTGDARTKAPEGAKRPADPIADMAEKATHATNLWEARRLVSAQPQKTRVAVIRAMPFSRRALMADLAGDPDKARGYRSLLDMLPYTEDSPTDRLLDMANRGDVRAAAALAAYGSDDERRELKKLPVAGHRAVMMALDGHEPKGRRHAAPPTAPVAPAPGPAAPKAPAAKSAPTPKTPGKAPASQRPRYASNRTPRYSRPRRRTFRERMARGVAGLRSIWSGVWEKWAAVFKGRRSRP